MISSGPETIIEPGVGGTDKSIGRLITITQDKGTTCVIDWNERLALGSHLFPGSSLHTNRTNQQFSTQGIGAADVSIPVNEILPQELSKTMTATVGQTYTWDVTKSGPDVPLSFANTCVDTTGSRSQNVQFTVTWTRSGPTSTGATTITTEVTAINPAHRTITVQATDNIYEGATQDVLLETKVGDPVDVPAETSMVVLSHTLRLHHWRGDDLQRRRHSHLHRQADRDPCPGQTSAAASATATPAGGAPAQSSVVVSELRVDHRHGPVLRGGDTVGRGLQRLYGRDVYNRPCPLVVHGNEQRIGDLQQDGHGRRASHHERHPVGYRDDHRRRSERARHGRRKRRHLVKCARRLQINKTIPAGSLRTEESVTFNFDITGPGGFSDDAAITFDSDDPLSKSTTLTGLAPGTYTVHEVPQANWADRTDQVRTITLPDCEGSVLFSNTTLASDLNLTKEADETPIVAGDEASFTIHLWNAGPGDAFDVGLHDDLPPGVVWDFEIVSGDAVEEDCNIASSQISGEEPQMSIDCEFGTLGVTTMDGGIVIRVFGAHRSQRLRHARQQRERHGKQPGRAAHQRVPRSW